MQHGHGVPNHDSVPQLRVAAMLYQQHSNGGCSCAWCTHSTSSTSRAAQMPYWSYTCFSSSAQLSHRLSGISCSGEHCTVNAAGGGRLGTITGVGECAHDAIIKHTINTLSRGTM